MTIVCEVKIIRMLCICVAASALAACGGSGGGSTLSLMDATENFITARDTFENEQEQVAGAEDELKTREEAVATSTLSLRAAPDDTRRAALTTARQALVRAQLESDEVARLYQKAAEDSSGLARATRDLEASQRAYVAAAEDDADLQADIGVRMQRFNEDVTQHFAEERRLRTTEGHSIATDRVPYEEGKALNFPGTVVEDEFPLEGITFRGNGRRDLVDPMTGNPNPGTCNSNPAACVVRSVGSAHLGADGLTIEAIAFSTAREDLALPTADNLGRAVDLIQNFGSPKPDPTDPEPMDPTNPDGGVSYWNADSPLPENLRTDINENPVILNAAGNPAMGVTEVEVDGVMVPFPDPSATDALEHWRFYRHNLGEYEVWLSNRVDDGSGDADYLFYAAFGLYHFLSNIQPQDDGTYGAPVTGPNTTRLTAFHFGLDAYADEDGDRASDHSADIIGAYTGRTQALYQVLPRLSDVVSSTEGVFPTRQRLRGDVKLMVDFAADLQIQGTINTLQSYDSDSDDWVDYFSTLSSVTLGQTTIGADGSYSGSATPAAGGRWSTSEGAWGGSFYGPADAPETAGYWTVEDATRSRDGVIVGSFGAKKPPPSP